MSTPRLKIENLFCERDERVLFEALCFEVHAGEVIQIEGQNGSGKTTLLRILSGLSSHFEGDIYWQGEHLEKCASEYREALLYFGHQPGVKAVLTPRENLHWYASLHPDMALEQLDYALMQVGLTGYEDVPCHTLSAGQNRRVSLARLYLSRAPLWILDEPFTAIDKQGVAAQEALMMAHAEQGGSVILTTHHELAMGDKIRRLNLDQLAGTL
ncbi:cytochrome c biogenesis heme-transporting ATPase CcmA [Amphritea opalescens]|uniref:Cytochrome c biogenesis heme-transporting ATPase CcmA n=1 Tax=Amphritea opalescens TaxID=2490544 RepID=A0A430KU29_9GAMM|nr:cytochrome c biogenesis heme-transporting ATPase CcmA [Amphritea opalescens]RTE66824.1 cytochrome c biogenesis heme-transporting ATPase CcmA [Amphritea opalescens]